MKKFLFMIVLLILLSACTTNSGTPIEPNENNMIIHIKNNTDFKLFGLEVAILNHSQGSVNADGSAIKKGDELTFELLKEDLELNGEVDMEVFILTDTHIEDNGDRIPLKDTVAVTLDSNKEIFFELTGETVNEAVLRMVK
ncbi:putative periplasmic lipoprotein [Bacillus timonensis]|uniref:hypothetical protein n=1 Tax=Bacillus timonensis TaxID=1033734 RepID=UPI0002897E4A|nr:hypothetical protein [Bacillus timonensis]